jgi:hypothetical protein
MRPAGGATTDPLKGPASLRIPSHPLGTRDAV